MTEQGHGRPILIVHGGGGTSAAWAGVAGHLMARARSRRSSSLSPTGTAMRAFGGNGAEPAGTPVRGHRGRSRQQRLPSAWPRIT